MGDPGIVAGPPGADVEFQRACNAKQVHPTLRGDHGADPPGFCAAPRGRAALGMLSSHFLWSQEIVACFKAAVLSPLLKELEGQGAGACCSAVGVAGTCPLPSMRYKYAKRRNVTIRRQESIPMRQMLRMAWSAMENAAWRSSAPPPSP